MFGLVSQKRFDELQTKHYNQLQERIDEYNKIEVKNRELANELNSLNERLLKIEQQIREQTEADLFFISAKIQKKLLDGEPKENVQDLKLQQLASQSQLGQMQSSPPIAFSNNISNLFKRWSKEWSI